MAPKTISTGEIETMGESGRFFWFFTSDSRAIARKVSEKLDGSYDWVESAWGLFCD